MLPHLPVPLPTRCGAEVDARGLALAHKLFHATREEFVVQGIHTTIPFYRDLIQHGNYVNGDFHIRFVEEFVESS